ncbi:hypothetical protein BaOVIS_016520 [Babesia ovis]|uniref:Uncharacterized protein n=1 Tax=Babesia ovis TaxID=5869 RepID=A0A9W5TAG5_BABOV|nr:hypothetical protein BaOVIS_016520 [Babesia ovis]
MYAHWNHLLGSTALVFLVIFALAECVELGSTTGVDTPAASLKVRRIRFERGQVYSEIGEVDRAFAFRTSDLQLKLTPDTLDILAKFKFDGTIAVQGVTSGDVKQWVLWEQDLFEAKKSDVWMPGDTSTCGRSGDYFLGGPCKLSKGRVNRFYLKLPPHSEIRVTGRVHFFDQWEGESLNIKADGATVWSQSHNWCPSVSNTECIKYGIDSCGQEYPDRLSVHYDISLPHKSDTLALEFNSTLEAEPCQASWGIDDVALFLR